MKKLIFLLRVWYYWMKVPDLRFGQFIDNATYNIDTKFYLTDLHMINLIKHFITTTKSNNVV